MMSRLALALALALAFAAPACAGDSTLAVTPGAGANMKEKTDGSGNLGPTVAVCDGVALANCAAVKAASTAAGATDPAVVVAISPNNTVAATQSGTWTVQPGNTANTTAWKVDGSAVTQPVNQSQVGGASVATAASGIAKVGLTDGSGNAITSTTNALDINIKSGGTVAAGSTTSGTGMSITGCATTTAAPSNTTAQNNFTSCDPAGNTRVVLPAVDPCQNSNIAKSSVAIGITTATTTALVAVSGSTTVYVCGFSLTISQVITTANTLKFNYGTGTACATGATDLTGLYGGGGVTAAAPIVISAGSGTLFKTPASNGLCAVTAIGATGSFQGVLTYVQI